jgi:FkbM family methyltransferase
VAVSKKSLLGKIARHAVRKSYGSMHVNFFAYEAARSANIKQPDIPVMTPEFYGQCGEDLIVLSLLRARSERSGIELKSRRYLEIGGNHPFATSATYLLSKMAGMAGAVVEANPALIPDLRACRTGDVVIHAAVHASDADIVLLTVSKLSELSSIDDEFVSKWGGAWSEKIGRVEVPALRINQIISRYLGDEAPAFLSIDVEGIDLQILQDLNLEKYRPWLIQIEPSDHHILGNGQAIRQYMESKSYELVAKTPVNFIFRDTQS